MIIKLFIFFLIFPLHKGFPARNEKILLGEEVKNSEEFFLSKDDEKIFVNLKKLLADKNWDEARLLNEKVKNTGFREAIGTYIELKRFKSVFIMSRESVIDLINFNSSNYFLRDFESFNKRIEFYYLNNTISFFDVKNYFNRFESSDINVKIKLFKDEEMYAEQLKDTDPKRSRAIREELDRKIRAAWINCALPGDEQEFFLENFSSRLTDKSFMERAETLVFKGNTETLEKLLPLMQNEGQRKLFDSILEIWKVPESIDDIVEEIPKSLRSNEALVFAKVRY
ncbi:MAG: hypothetical protein LBP39_02525 [Rickettsiales bacterium]|jgi:hypothetical protein|nr:hypothetical protein [Rickettsiales bacterium]